MTDEVSDNFNFGENEEPVRKEQDQMQGGVDISDNELNKKRGFEIGSFATTYKGEPKEVAMFYVIDEQGKYVKGLCWSKYKVQQILKKYLPYMRKFAE